MCFSASASFTASGVLAIIGIASVREIKNKQQLPLAMMPFTFALQQLCEGIDWLSVAHIPWAVSLATIATTTHVFVILCVWPFMFPYITWLLARKRMQELVAYFCFVLASISLLLFLSELPLPIRFNVIYCHLDIVLTPAKSVRGVLAGIIYIINLCLAAIFWPIPRIIKIFGILTVPLAWLISAATFTSVWCFFAALWSICVLYSIKQLNKSCLSG